MYTYTHTYICMYTYKFNLNTICELNAIILKNESSEEAKSGTSQKLRKTKTSQIKCWSILRNLGVSQSYLAYIYIYLCTLAANHIKASLINISARGFQDGPGGFARGFQDGHFIIARFSYISPRTFRPRMFVLHIYLLSYRSLARSCKWFVVNKWRIYKILFKITYNYTN